MFLPGLTICLGITVVMELLFAGPALAWGPAVHTVTALSVLDDVRALLPEISKIITTSPLQYLYGCLAADFFIGKGRPGVSGHPHNWEGGFRFLREAEGDRESAFAYGFLSHLAADVVAHNFFVPTMMGSMRHRKRRGHLYWEVRADYLMGPDYIRIARDVLTMDHKGCDDLLALISGKGGNGLKTKKRIFTQSVKFSDYLYTAHPLLFSGKAVRRKDFQMYLALMVGISCRLVKDFLGNPHSSPCLSYDPMGKAALRQAKRKWPLGRPLNRCRSIRRSALDRGSIVL